MYLTATEYNTYTGRSAAEATTIRITTACKMLDSRIGNYQINQDGWKIDSSGDTWYIYLPQQYTYNCSPLNSIYNEVTTAQKQAIKMWVAGFIEQIVLYGTKPQSNNNIKLGRFSVNNGANNNTQILPQNMGFYDSILISSGIINRRVKSV
jgi:hypothetical protein